MTPLPDRIYVTGPSGAGTTTLGRLIAEGHGHRHLDTDDFFWEPTDPPYSTPRPVAERVRLLARALRAPRWVLSGSLDSWGDQFTPLFDLVIWLVVPTEVRVTRLRERELAEFGDRILPGGDMYGVHEGFLEWTRKYDTAGMEMRSRARHAAWTGALSCPVIRIDGEHSPQSTLARITSEWEALP
jgi:adenylate kinase family enzyme